MAKESIYTYIKKQYGPRRRSPLPLQAAVVVTATLACYFAIEVGLSRLSKESDLDLEIPTAAVQSRPQDDMPSPSPAGFFQRAYRDGAWRGHLGDTSITGCVFTGGYLLAALFCLVSTGWPAQRFKRPSAHAWCWWLLAVALLCLGVNQQLPLQQFLTDIGAEIAKADASSAQTESMRIHLIATYVATCLCLYLILMVCLRRAPLSAHVALSGLFTLIVLVGVQTVSHRPIDEILGYSMGHVSLAQSIESVALGCVLVSGAAYWPHRQIERTYILQ